MDWSHTHGCVRYLCFAICLSALPPTARALEPSDASLSLLGQFELLCPICRRPFSTLGCTHTNTRGGIDRDLFARALGPQPEFYRISTCPRCGYSGYAADFDPDLTLPPDFIERVAGPEATRPRPAASQPHNPPNRRRLPLPAEFNERSNPRELDAAVRYTLAITCYKWRQRSDEALAWLYLRASWVAREEGSSLPRDDRLARVMKYIERWKPLLEPGGNQLDVEMQIAGAVSEAIACGEFGVYQKPYVQLALALILRRHGENTQAAPLLDKLLKTNSFSPDLREAMSRMHASIDAERRLQRDALTCFERALLAEQIAPGNRPAALYLTGELSRRLGRDDQAVRWFDGAIRTTPAGSQLAAWAREQRSRCVQHPQLNRQVLRR